MARSRGERLERQRERQRAVRAETKKSRKPTRDDIARTLLHWAVTENIRHGREEELFQLQVQVVDQLVAQGFEKQASDVAWDALVDKYRMGWSFQRKRHLTSKEGEEDGAL